jgi:hypothetical protein
MRSDISTAHALAERGWLRAALRQRFGDDRGQALFDRVRATYADLLAQPSPFVDTREQALAETTILPLVALYQTLQADGLTSEAAQTEVRRLQAQHLRERRLRGLAVARRLPLYRHWLRRQVRREVEAAFPTPAFSIALAEDTPDTLAYDVRRCPFQTVAVAYGVPELLPTFCRLDEVRFDVLAQDATCQRSAAFGEEGCRFRFRLEPDRQTLEDAESYLAF